MRKVFGHRGYTKAPKNRRGRPVNWQAEDYLRAHGQSAQLRWVDQQAG